MHRRYTSNGKLLSITTDSYMPYANRDSVRKLAGNISTTNVSDSEIDGFITYSDARVENATGMTFTVGTRIYNLAVAASEHFAAARIREMFADPNKVAEQQYNTGEDIIKDIISFATSGTQSPSFFVVKGQSYATYPLNPKGDVFRSIRGQGNVKPTASEIFTP
jgi:hypothetical protein